MRKTASMRIKRLQNNLLPEVDQQQLDTAELRIDEWNQEMLDWCNSLPSSYEFQKQTIYRSNYV